MRVIIFGKEGVADGSCNITKQIKEKFSFIRKMRKLMKRIICILCLIIQLITVIPFNASTYDVQFCENEAYTAEEIEILNQKNTEAYNEYLGYKDQLTANGEVSVMAMPVTTSYLINVPNYTQKRNNWCGPACVRQTLAFHAIRNGINLSNVPSQSTIAIALGIYNSGRVSSADMIYKQL